MFAAPSRPLVFHGEQIGVTTLSMARLQERMLDSVPVVVADSDTKATFRARYGEELGASCWGDFANKRLTAERVEALNARIAQRWPDVQEQIGAILLPSVELTAVLETAGSPLTAKDIHLPRSFYDEALLHGREIRNRYTFLDLAANAGWLTTLVPNL
jgi:glycerol-1-phosphate dehydrogenase [NAD(P)+]